MKYILVIAIAIFAVVGSYYAGDGYVRCWHNGGITQMNYRGMECRK